MAKVDLAATMRQAQDDGLIGTNAFKMKDGTNRVRVVQGFLPYQSDFTDKDGIVTTNFKWLTRVIDRRTGKVMTFYMGHTIYKQLIAFQQDTESGTDFDQVPLPYDININATGAGTLLAKYTVIPGKRSDITLDEQFLISAEDSLEELREALQKKKPQRSPSTPVRHDDDDIPA